MVIPRFGGVGVNAGGGNWGVRIRGRPKSQETVTNIYFYAGLEGLGQLQLVTPFNTDVSPPGFARLTGRRDLRMISNLMGRRMASATFQFKSLKVPIRITIPNILTPLNRVSKTRFMRPSHYRRRKCGRQKVVSTRLR
jgi:hypothetical protein